MSCPERTDDFEARRERLRAMSDEELSGYFWEIAGKIVSPLIEEARTHTTPSIERSVLLRMGFSSTEAGGLVEEMGRRKLLRYGAGKLVLDLARAKGIDLRTAGKALLRGKHWEDLSR